MDLNLLLRAAARELLADHVCVSAAFAARSSVVTVTSRMSRTSSAVAVDQSSGGGGKQPRPEPSRQKASGDDSHGRHVGANV
jgi:hypothetical protein